MNLYQEVNSPNHCFVVAGPNSGAVLFGSLNMETTENDLSFLSFACPFTPDRSHENFVEQQDICGHCSAATAAASITIMPGTGSSWL